MVYPEEIPQNLKINKQKFGSRAVQHSPLVRSQTAMQSQSHWLRSTTANPQAFDLSHSLPVR
jgi:hypothetical protein